MNSALLTLYRSLTRHRLYAALNIGGLALGIAVFLALALFVRYEYGFNRFAGADRLWVMQERYDAPGRKAADNPHVMGGELDRLRDDFPGLKGARWSAVGGTVTQGGESNVENLVLIDPDFLTLFDFTIIAGSPAKTLAEPDGVVINQTIARRYFGSRSPIGQPITLTIGPQRQAFRVGAVVADAPRNRDFNGSLFVRYSRERVGDDAFGHWGKTVGWTFLQFPDAAAAGRFEAQLPAFLQRHAFPTGEVRRGEYSQSLRPLPELHLFLRGERAIVAALGIVGLLTLGIAIINYINLATARAELRAREVAIRKVLGGTRRSLIAQFLGEALASVALAALVGLALAELTLPFVNALGGTELAIRYLGMDGVVPLLVSLVLVVGVLAGFYPAIILSRYQPAAVLASARAPGGRRTGVRLRQGLVVVQFAVAIAIAIGTAVMFAQVAHLRAADLGFRRDGLLLVPVITDSSLDATQRRQLLAAFAALPAVTSATVADIAPSWLPAVESSQVVRPEMPLHKVAATIVPTSLGYFDTYGARLIAGRVFDSTHGLDSSAGTSAGGGNVVLNRSAVGDLGFTSPADAIGQIVRGAALGDSRVIGVIADMKFQSPRDPATPVVYTRGADGTGQMFAVRFAGRDPQAVADDIERVRQRLTLALTFQIESADEGMESFYQQDAQRSRLFTIGAVLAVLIGCIGLYGLASFDTARRVKEIGIRKTLGASTRDILKLLIGQFLRPVMIANLIAWPIAYFAMRQWLSGFDDRVALSPWFFVAASVVAIAIATLTVVGQAWRVARAEPARALRHE